MKNKSVIGIDIGGSKINIGTVSSKGQISNLKKIKSFSDNANKNKENIVTEISNIIKNESKALKGIGIATAGRIDFKQKKILYTTDNLKDWSNIDIVNILENKFNCPVYIDNDVNTALLSELEFNKFKSNSIIIFLAIGTGLGGALAINGKIIRGKSGSVGEFGHMTLYPGGKKCNCGKRGCAEQYISGSAYKKNLKNELKKFNEEDLNISTIQKNIMAKKEPYISILKTMSHDLALLLDNLKNSLDFDICIIGGSFNVYQDIILKELDNKLKRLKYNYMDDPSIYFTKQNNKAGVVGAGLMVYKQLSKN